MPFSLRGFFSSGIGSWSIVMGHRIRVRNHDEPENKSQMNPKKYEEK